jgi:hypothetical protein
MTGGVLCGKTAADAPEVRALLLDATIELLEALRRLALLTERLAARASLSPDEARNTPGD